MRWRRRVVRAARRGDQSLQIGLACGVRWFGSSRHSPSATTCGRRRWRCADHEGGLELADDRTACAGSPGRVWSARWPPPPGCRRRPSIRRRWSRAGRSASRCSRGSRATPRRDGRWVASTRCRPSDRPRRAMATRLGHEVAELVGEGGELVDDDHESRNGLCVARLRGTTCRSAAPPVASSRSRRRISLSSAVSTRRVSCSSRSVTSPTVCGRSGALAERRAALVVDQQERHGRRWLLRSRGRRRGIAAARTCRRRCCRRSARAGRRGRDRCVTGPSAPTPMRGAHESSGDRPALRRSASPISSRS